MLNPKLVTAFRERETQQKVLDLPVMQVVITSTQIVYTCHTPDRLSLHESSIDLELTTYSRFRCFTSYFAGNGSLCRRMEALDEQSSVKKRLTRIDLSRLELIKVNQDSPLVNRFMFIHINIAILSRFSNEKSSYPRDRGVSRSSNEYGWAF